MRRRVELSGVTRRRDKNRQVETESVSHGKRHYAKSDGRRPPSDSKQMIRIVYNSLKLIRDEFGDVSQGVERVETSWPIYFYLSPRVIKNQTRDAVARGTLLN